MKKKVENLPATKKDLEDMTAYIVSAIAKTLEEYPTKDDLKQNFDSVEKELKADIRRVEDKIDNHGADISDHTRRIRDLETDTITRKEFIEFKVKVLPS